MKKLLIIPLILLGCKTTEKIKVYSSQPDKGMFRLQDGEIVPYDQTQGWLCMSPDQAKEVLYRCKSEEN